MAHLVSTYEISIRNLMHCYTYTYRDNYSCSIKEFITHLYT